MENKNLILDSIKQRMEILCQSGIINRKIEWTVKSFIEKLLDDVNKPDRHAFESLATHLAMALARSEKLGPEQEIAMPDDIYAQIKESDLYSQVVMKMKEHLTSYFDILPEEERKYILLHMINVYEGDEN